VFILVLLAVIVGSSLSLFAWRAPRIGQDAPASVVSRDSLVLTNAVLLLVATATVLLGTIYPLVVDALGQGKLSVGAPYFNAVFVPLMVPVLCLLVPGIWLRWKDDRISRLRPLLIDLVIAATTALAVPLLMARAGWGDPPWGVSIGLLAGVWITAGSLHLILRRLRQPGRIPLAYWGMHVAHIGMAVVVLGITLVKGYEIERDVRMAVGDTLTLRGYRFELNGVHQVQGPNYQAMQAEVTVTRGQAPAIRLLPEKRQYESAQMMTTEAAIDYGLMRDLYVSLGEPIDGTRSTEWTVRLFYKPFVAWLWIGGLLMAAGGLMAAADRRYRRVRATVHAAQPMEVPAA
jgi:cytochrome c-type biogenesis protein CcmF